MTGFGRPGTRRVWNQVTVAADRGGFVVRLDRHAVRTPAARPMTLPTRRLAEAIAAEWDAVEAHLRPEAMPMTRAAATAIDRVAPNRDEIAATIAAYGDTDLICYRATEPAALVARQAEAWDPWLTWAATALDAPLCAVAGVMPADQPEAARLALRRAVDALDPWQLTGLSELTSLTGSLVLALALTRGALAPETAWTLSRLDETFQAEHWGRDAEAEAAAARRLAAFEDAVRWTRLLDQP